ncbi:aminoglycoside phosphotransferase family protein [Kangiella koreensis]|uniref:Aminoglycoside phosphotransferase n=1 Tax=Kangiella koreensis (strain DSM 16069 / JCM 12317 / KCTC 12182 / SW-125) TaxID=523791 RepID=C7R7T7_KANKD|nr:phosphotransferase [Kangiella koreensis]ACV27620.1 aminoglycoside phosphotransferase [Kangiella koreensis DSM 16069]
MEKDSRQEALKNWAYAKIRHINPDIGALQWSMVSGDASFRRYFRWQDDDTSWICVDAPPEHENSEQFIKVANMLKVVNAPQVLAYDLTDGFMLLSDLGDQLYLPLLLNPSESASSADALYQSAIDSLVTMQSIDNADSLPPYDSTLLNTEMELFREWFLGRYLNYPLSEQEHQLLDDTFKQLTSNALEQPQVFVHRDYHSRNIMHIEGKDPGIIDFQDAVYGPITYDLLSLLRDCYIQWPQDKVVEWVDYFIEQSPFSLEKQTFLRWFDWMGLQRHIKVAGIFSRLNFRDGKSGYLKDIPLTLNYILQQSENYPEMANFHQWLQDTIMPLYRKRVEEDALGVGA